MEIHSARRERPPECDIRNHSDSPSSQLLLPSRPVPSSGEWVGAHIHGMPSSPDPLLGFPLLGQVGTSTGSRRLSSPAGRASIIGVEGGQGRQKNAAPLRKPGQGPVHCKQSCSSKNVLFTSCDVRNVEAGCRGAGQTLGLRGSGGRRGCWQGSAPGTRVRREHWSQFLPSLRR